MIGEIPLATNGTVDLYSTSMTRIYTEHLNRRENYGYFEDAMVVEIRDTKTKEPLAYAMVSKDYKKYYFDFNDGTEFDVKLFCVKSQIDEERDIIAMAKNKTKEAEE